MNHKLHPANKSYYAKLGGGQCVELSTINNDKQKPLSAELTALQWNGLGKEVCLK